jgi:nicotinamide-nucleotide amidase
MSTPHAQVVELFVTGDEVLRGTIADTNSATTAAKLYPLGFTVRRITGVMDRGEDIRRALLEISARADWCLVSGGLGPTSDDLTAACAAQAAGVELRLDEPWLAGMRARWAQRRAEPMPLNNERQAWVPEGCELLGNPDGSAPAFALRIDRCHFFFLPGVPREHHRIVDELVIPRMLAALHGTGHTAHRSRVLQCVGIAESKLDELVSPARLAHPKVRFGFRTKFPENHLSLAARAETVAEAESLLAAAEADCRKELGSFIYGQDGVSFAQAIGNLLVARSQTLACAESCTGGLVSQLCTEYAGSSRSFVGAFITYSNDLKERAIGVRHETLVAHGAVSRETALEMAVGAREKSGASWALSITGIAGPDGGSAEKPVGTVFIGIAGPNGVLEARANLFRGDRGQVRTQSAFAALQLLREQLTR